MLFPLSLKALEFLGEFGCADGLEVVCDLGVVVLLGEEEGGGSVQGPRADVGAGVDEGFDDGDVAAGPRGFVEGGPGVLVLGVDRFGVGLDGFEDAREVARRRREVEGRHLGPRRKGVTAEVLPGDGLVAFFFFFFFFFFFLKKVKVFFFFRTVVWSSRRRRGVVTTRSSEAGAAVLEGRGVDGVLEGDFVEAGGGEYGELSLGAMFGGPVEVDAGFVAALGVDGDEVDEAVGEEGTF
mmetsp:Transcript_10150/g.33204  ORF Transcript_10150/g.33204 Transcript_10150/m.33204 type:complete len:238 (+) Transcript_10150:1208-1921(+)